MIELKACEKCGSANLQEKNHKSKACDDRYNREREQLEPVERTEYWIELICNDCKHVRYISL